VEEEELMIATVGKKPDKEDKDEEVLATVAHYAMAHYAENEVIKKNYKPKSGQYPSEAGIKWFGEQGETAVTKELNQFNKYKVFKPQDATDLSEKDKKKALTSLIFLNKNKGGDIKARSCANGNTQREHIMKEETAVPTVALESGLITSTNDAKKVEWW
jgi:hypothetical protein